MRPLQGALALAAVLIASEAVAQPAWRARGRVMTDDGAPYDFTAKSYFSAIDRTKDKDQQRALSAAVADLTRIASLNR